MTGGPTSPTHPTHPSPTPSSPSSITQVPLTHKDPSKSILTKAFHHVRDYKTAVKNGRALAPYSYIERKARAATRSTVPYGPLGGELVELAQISHRGIEACQTLYRVLVERLDRSNQKWRNVGKALDVLEYVLVRGSVEFVDMVKRDSGMLPRLTRLEGFAYVTSDAESRDVGAGVRRKATEVRGLLEEGTGRLEEARGRGEVQSRKMAGLDAGGSREENGGWDEGASGPSEPTQPEYPHSRTLSTESAVSTKGVSEDENLRYMEALGKLLARPENMRCADCGLKTPRPSWASVNLGVYLCLRCAGIHRSLGVHVSQVRSCTLDVWTCEQLEVMVRCGGNLLANSYWECRLGDKPSMMTIGDVERFVLRKYVERAYVPSPDSWSWPPASDGSVDNELEEILLTAMDEETRVAYLRGNEGRMVEEEVDVAHDVVCDEASMGGDALISLIDSDGDIPLDVADLPGEGLHDAVEALFEGLVVGVEDVREDKGDELGAPSETALEDVWTVSAQSNPSPECPSERPVALTSGPLRTPKPEHTSCLARHEKKAQEMMANLLEDFDISSSIATSVSPMSRAEAARRPMRGT